MTHVCVCFLDAALSAEGLLVRTIGLKKSHFLKIRAGRFVIALSVAILFTMLLAIFVESIYIRLFWGHLVFF